MTKSRYVPTRRALLIVNGLTNLTAAGLLLARKPAGAVLGGVFGVTLMLWICIQFYIFPPNFMPIQPVGIDLTACDHVTVCTPIWVFALAAAVRSFCAQAAGRIREADYILVHHQNSTYANAAQEMDALLGIRHTGLRSIRCREGVYREKD